MKCVLKATFIIECVKINKKINWLSLYKYLDSISKFKIKPNIESHLRHKLGKKQLSIYKEREREKQMCHTQGLISLL